MFYCGGDYEARKGSGIAQRARSACTRAGTRTGRSRAPTSAASASSSSTNSPSWSTRSGRCGSARAARRRDDGAYAWSWSGRGPGVVTPPPRRPVRRAVRRRVDVPAGVGRTARRPSRLTQAPAGLVRRHRRAVRLQRRATAPGRRAGARARPRPARRRGRRARRPRRGAGRGRIAVQGCTALRLRAVEVPIGRTRRATCCGCSPLIDATAHRLSGDPGAVGDRAARARPQRGGSAPQAAHRRHVDRRVPLREGTGPADPAVRRRTAAVQVHGRPASRGPAPRSGDAVRAPRLPQHPACGPDRGGDRQPRRHRRDAGRAQRGGDRVPGRGPDRRRT